MHYSILYLLPSFSFVASATLHATQNICNVVASGTNKTDDAPAIRSAFSQCNHGGKIVFGPTTYYINSVLDITGLENVDIDIQGKLLVRPITAAQYA